MGRTSAFVFILTTTNEIVPRANDFDFSCDVIKAAILLRDIVFLAILVFALDDINRVIGPARFGNFVHYCLKFIYKLGVTRCHR